MIMTRLLWIAGAVQILVAGANLPAKRLLPIREDLARVSPIVRQIYHVQHAYIVAILLFFGALCFLRTGELAAGGPLPAFLALFWGARILVQRLYYDPEVRRRHRAADVGFTAAFAYLTAVFGAAALGGLAG
jgi:hypothetical protein